MLEESKHFRKGRTQTKEVKANWSDDLKFLRADQRAFEICLPQVVPGYCFGVIKRVASNQTTPNKGRTWSCRININYVQFN